MATVPVRSDQQSQGRYVQGGTVELKGKRLGWWERKIFATSPTDVAYTITAKYARRPDLLAFDFYGQANLQWVIMQYNSVSDLNEDFTVGMIIALPTKSRLFGELLTTPT